MQGKYDNMKVLGQNMLNDMTEENNTAKYQQTILSSVGGQDKLMKDYTPDEQNKIMAAMQRHEGFKSDIGTPYNSKPDTSMFTRSEPPAKPVTEVAVPPKLSNSEELIKLAQTMTDSELKKQTLLLAQLVQNTSGSGRQYAMSDSYKKDPATVMSGVAG